MATWNDILGQASAIAGVVGRGAQGLMPVRDAFGGQTQRRAGGTWENQSPQQRGQQPAIANMLAGVQQNRQQLQQPDAEQRGFQQALQLLNAQQEGQANLQQRGLQAQAQMNADAIQGRLRQQALDNQGSLDQIMARGPYDMFGDLAGQLSNPWQYDTAAMLEKGRQGRFDSLLPLLQGLYGGGASGGMLPRVTGFKADNINQYGMLPNF